MIKNSVKPLEEYSAGYSVLAESTNAPMIMIFLDFSEPKIKAKSENLLKMLEDIQPMFAKNYIFTWTDDEQTLRNRRNLGVTWDELPAMALSS